MGIRRGEDPNCHDIWPILEHPMGTPNFTLLANSLWKSFHRPFLFLSLSLFLNNSLHNMLFMKKHTFLQRTHPLPSLSFPHMLLVDKCPHCDWSQEKPTLHLHRRVYIPCLLLWQNTAGACTVCIAHFISFERKGWESLSEQRNVVTFAGSVWSDNNHSSTSAVVQTETAAWISPFASS